MLIFYIFVQNTGYEKMFSILKYIICLWCKICALIYIYIFVELGGFTWEGILKGTLEEECPADELPKSLSSIINTDNIDKTVIQTAEEVQLALGSLKQVMS